MYRDGSEIGDCPRTCAICHDWCWSLSSSCDHYHHHLDHNGDLNKNTVDGVHDHHIAAFNDDHHHADYVDLKDRKKLTKAHLVVNLLLKLTFALITMYFWYTILGCHVKYGISDLIAIAILALAFQTQALLVASINGIPMPESWSWRRISARISIVWWKKFLL